MFRSIWKKNWTPHLGWVQGIGGSVTALMAYLGSVINNADVKAAIEALHLDPKICVGIAVLGAITLLSVEH